MLVISLECRRNAAKADIWDISHLAKDYRPGDVFIKVS